MKSFIKSLGSTLLILASIHLLAHSPSETHSTIYMNGDMLNVQIELPWSISDAVIKYHPESRTKTSKSTFMPFVIDYLTNHFEVFKNDKAIQCIETERLPGEHSHSEIMVLKYPAGSMKNLRINNSIMFNLNKRQKNHHKLIFVENKKWNVTTTSNRPSFITENPAFEKSNIALIEPGMAAVRISLNILKFLQNIYFFVP